MNKEQQIEYFNTEIAALELAKSIIEKLGDKLSDKCRLSPQGVFWIHTDNREDLEQLMTLAPIWTKSPGSSGIDYWAPVNGISITIKAEGEALPQTCKLVEEEYDIPEQPAVPARKAVRMVLKCAQATAPVPQPEEAPANV